MKSTRDKKVKEELDHQIDLLTKKFLYEVYKQIRIKKMRRAELAALLQVSPGYLSQLFHNKKPLTFTMLVRFQQALHIEFEIKTRSHDEQKTKNEN
ncbi:hypothetical protein A3860_07365 [Niastella vici]|uniref:HTH cro/C1-type domain-containing protein n=1 Tax=Niastella vici TaxID=1703345 RepID=A0A1V9FIN1_9BACT|nr:helix-turn-helix transcriptional regulator [Niastella vici]OQP58137.1 hypothetical protein A3860_07365 [Niastella vici]